MKTLSLELCKRLEEHLKEKKSEYIYIDDTWYDFAVCENTLKYWLKSADLKWWPFKAPTLEEAIDLLPDEMASNEWTLTPYFDIVSNNFYYSFDGKYPVGLKVLWTPMLWMEKMLTYLLDNDLLWIKAK